MRSNVTQEKVSILGCRTHFVSQFRNDFIARYLRSVAILSAAEVEGIDFPIEDAELMLFVVAAKPDLETEVWRTDRLDYRFIFWLELKFLLRHDRLVFAPELPLLVFGVWFGS